MSIYYLYVKTHKKTGLKYLGKTQQNPFKYKGSGIYWKNHLRLHGYDIDTKIIKECQTAEEIREWGIYYSKIWNIVDSDEWANLKEETGQGWTTEEMKILQQKRVADGTHNLLGGEIQRQTNRKRVEDGSHQWLGDKNPVHQRIADGTHNFLGDGEFQRQTALKRVADGTNPFCDSEFNRQVQQKRVADGTHNLLGENNPSHKRVADGTHNFLDGDFARYHTLKRVEDGTHPWLGGEIQRQTQRKRIEDGTHNFQTPWICEHCGKSGKGTSNYSRWHKNGVCLTR